MKHASKWREVARQTIWNTLKKEGINSGRDALQLSDNRKKAIIKAVSDAYPFGLRENHPYKIWCSETNKILSGLRIKPDHAFKPGTMTEKTYFQNRVLIDDPRQMRFL